MLDAKTIYTLSHTGEDVVVVPDEAAPPGSIPVRRAHLGLEVGPTFFVKPGELYSKLTSDPYRRNIRAVADSPEPMKLLTVPGPLAALLDGIPPGSVVTIRIETPGKEA